MNMTQLGPELVQWLDGNDLEQKQHAAMQLLTVSEEAWPHQAMISMGEVLAVTPTMLRLALWPGTQTSMNMSRTGKATLIAVHEQRLLYVRLVVSPLPPLTGSLHARDRFEAKVVSVRIDHAPYAEITSGITFQLKDESGAIMRWRETLRELRQ